MPTEAKHTVIRCPKKLKPGGCTLHNLQCGWPKCNEPAEAAADTATDAELPGYAMLPGRWDVADERNRAPGEPEAVWEARRRAAARWWAEEDARREAAELAREAAVEAGAPMDAGGAADTLQGATGAPAAPAQATPQAPKARRNRGPAAPQVGEAPAVVQAWAAYEQALHERDLALAQWDAYVAGKRAAWATAVVQAAKGGPV